MIGTPTEVPFVSVIVPTHRRRVLLGRLLHSLLAQDWPADRYEIIVVHNFTDDGTDRLALDIANTAPVRVHYHRTAFRGPGFSRQFGAERARGAILAFIDDDCEATPGWIAAGVAGIGKGLALVQGRTMPRHDQQRRLMEQTVSVTAATPYFETCNIFYDAAVFRAVGGFPEVFRKYYGGEDTALGWTVQTAGYRTGFAEDALVLHEVFAVSFLDWLLRPRILQQWPFLVRAYPALREKLFLGIFLSPLTATFDLFALGVVGATLIHPLLALLCAPYVVLRFVDSGRFNAPHVLLARFVFGLPRGAVTAAMLLVGSIRARALVI
jgi:glycosyltransferase involved in cell wall biosynthesis